MDDQLPGPDLRVLHGLAHRPHAQTTGIARVSVVLLLLQLAPRDLHLRRIGHDDVVADVHATYQAMNAKQKAAAEEKKALSHRVSRATEEQEKSGRQLAQATETPFLGKVPLDQRVRIDLVLQVGSISETATVVGQVPLVEVSSSDIGSVIENRRIVDLPLNGRNFIALNALDAGAATRTGVLRGKFLEKRADSL